MDYGYFLTFAAPGTKDPERLFDEMVEQTRLARDGGFDLITTAQHFLMDDSTHLQQVPLLSRLTAETGSMMVGPGISLLPLQNPVYIAEEVATLDVMANRAFAGVGAGYRDVEFDAFGVPKSERAQRMKEGVELMNRLWTEENVTYDGEIYSVENATMNPRPDEKPEVWMAASAKAAVARAARLGDRLFTNSHLTFEELDEHRELFNRISEEEGRDTSVVVMRDAVVASTTEEAHDIARDALRGKYESYYEWGQYEGSEHSTDIDPVEAVERLANDRALIGTPAEICEQLERFRTPDVSHVLLRLQWAGPSHERVCEELELLGDEVIPNV